MAKSKCCPAHVPGLSETGRIPPIAIQIESNSHLKEVGMTSQKFLQSIFIQVDNCDTR